MNDLETVISMLSCRALEISYNPNIERIMEPCISQNQKEILSMWV